MESARQTEPPGQGPAVDLWQGMHPAVRKPHGAFDREVPRLLGERRGIPEEEVFVVRIQPAGELLFAGAR